MKLLTVFNMYFLAAVCLRFNYMKYLEEKNVKTFEILFSCIFKL